MLFWIVAALLTLAASLAVLAPLTRGRLEPAGRSTNDLEVYRDQLAEVERDIDRRLIAPSEAEQARAEIGRRILRVAGPAAPAAARMSDRRARLVGGMAVLAVPLLSWGFYAALGSPDLPSQPLEERLAKLPQDSTPDELVARAERALRDNPGDGRGWDVLAPVYQRLGRANEAVFAYRNAIKLLGDAPERWTGLGVALSDVAGGTVSADARAAFEKALQLEAGYPKARFFLNVAAVQEGRFDDAISDWKEMATTLPQESEWRGAAAQAVAMAEQRRTAADTRPSGPTEDDMAAAGEMSEGDRNQMIEAMVASLDEKLKANPNDLEGWKRLVRSYVVLGKTDAARDALTRGHHVLDGAAAEDLTAFAASLGLSMTE
ncbi:c-type cytochrome biogenesis protein CcmI [Arvimicrobium flavum]|uniref:c-type cytochrome biogenesis protein CcmI n=1 Tax=Arvimicrobium flavum TaxID=3393320 RepID=UPI00237B7207|nr:c-type cytochrome biogenesis protein CcmI [Mesorhizobium shangrilense]